MRQFLIELTNANPEGQLTWQGHDLGHTNFLKDTFHHGYLRISPPPFGPKRSFVPMPAPQEYEPLLNKLALYGLITQFGEWTDPGRPFGLTIDVSALHSRAHGLGHELWLRHRLHTTKALSAEVVNALAWGRANALLLRALCDQYPEAGVVVHLHDWPSGLALLFDDLPVKSVYSPHRTVLEDISAPGAGQDPIVVAQRHGRTIPYQLEKLIAQQSNILAPVRQQSAHHGHWAWGRVADRLFIPGYSQKTAASSQAEAARQALHNVGLAFFTPSYHWGSSKELLIGIVTAGQPESAKKIGLFLNKLRDLLRPAKQEATVFCFSTGEAGNLEPVCAQSLRLHRSLGQTLRGLGRDFTSRLVHYFTHRQPSLMAPSLSPETLTDLRRCFREARRSGQLPLWTHTGAYRHNLERVLARLGFRNERSDPVKIVLTPNTDAARTDLFGSSSLETSPIIGCDLIWGVEPQILTADQYHTCLQAGTYPLVPQEDVFRDALSYIAQQEESAHPFSLPLETPEHSLVQLEYFWREYNRDLNALKETLQKAAQQLEWEHLVPIRLQSYNSLLRDERLL